VADVIDELAEQAARIRQRAARTAEGNAAMFNDIIRMLNTADRLIADLKTEAAPTEWIGRHGIVYPLDRVLAGADGDRWRMFGWRPDRLTPIFENVSADVHGLWILDLQEVADRYGPLSAEAGGG